MIRASLATAAFAALLSLVAGQNCVPLSGSTLCPAFSNASVSTDSSLIGSFPFLVGVTNAATFDENLKAYVSAQYVVDQYRNRLGCQNVNTSDTADYYARYTTSYLCSMVVQNSMTPCGLSDTQAPPLCAESCASFATSEEEIVVDSAVCSSPISSYLSILRSDYTICALPNDSITASCVQASANEMVDCGYRSPSGETNMIGFCNYCRGSTENATDSCCFTQNATSQCQNVVLPSIFASISSFAASPTSTSSTTSTGTSATGTAASTGNHNGLSGGAIAGIVVGVVVGVLLLLGLLVFGCLAYRRRNRDSVSASTLNQPSPQRKGGDVAAMSYNPPSSAQGYEVLAGGRVARMNAMQGEEAQQTGQRHYSARELYGDNPASPGVLGAIRSPGSHDSSPDSNDFSSPEGVASGQSEQLPFFKDYYSNGDIRPNDKVSVLWAYQPRAGDEFELERGDMLKVVGIWDDGWATGVRIDERAEDYDGKLKDQRDSGVSNGSPHEDSPVGGEIKAFPLVCVCLPEAWKKTVEGDSSTEGGSGGNQI